MRKRLLTRLRYGLTATIVIAAMISCGTEAGPARALPARSLSFTSASPGNIFAAQSGSVDLSFPDAADISSGTVSLSDCTGRQLRDFPVTPGTASASIPLNSKGCYAIKASIDYRDGSNAALSTSVAVLGAPVPETERNPSRLGIWNVNGDLKTALAAGSRWTRRFWGLKDYKLDASGNPLPFDFAKPPMDQRFNWIGTLAWSMPSWLTGIDAPKNELYPPTDWNRLAALVERFANDAQDFPPYFEAFNEPDAHWKGTEDDLVRFITTIAQSIKSARPGTLVFGPSLYEINIAKLDRLVSKGLLSSLDGISIHAYVNGTPPEGDFMDRVKALRAYLTSIGKPDFPVYITEYGWTSSSGTWQKPVGEITQAQYLARSFALLSTEDIKAAVYFCLFYANAPNSGETEFSILHKDGTTKPAFAAMSNAMRWLSGAPTGRWLRAGDGNLAVFAKGADTVVAAWDTGSGSDLIIEAQPITAEDMMGAPVQNSSLSRMDGSPVYMRFPGAAAYGTAQLSPVTIDRGGSAPVPFTGAWGNENISIHNGNLSAPASAKAGKYMLIGSAADGWKALPVEVR